MKYQMFAAAAFLVLSSCGGGSSGGVQTGILIDSPVAGVSYATASESGITNSDGEFSYQSGQSITFSIGDLAFPSVTAASRITPMTLAGGNSTTALNIARLLQSLDEDSNPSNGITIPAAASQIASNINFAVSSSEFETDSQVVNLVANSGASTTTLVSSEAALAHLASNGIDLSENTPDRITVVSWGGAYTRSQVEAYHKPWTAASGNQITSVDYNGELTDIRSQVLSGNVTWDVVDVELAEAESACSEGLLESMDVNSLPPAPDGTPAVSDFIEGTLHECAVASIIWSTVVGYNTNNLGNTPASISDFFDTDAFPGKRGVRKNPKGVLEIALLADGVSASDVYAQLATVTGQDRAFAKLDEIKADIIWWQSGAEPVDLLSRQDVAMTTIYNGRLFNEIAGNNNSSYQTLWDGQIWDMDLWVVPKGSPNKTLAMDFVRFATATEQLAAQASYIAYGPARKSSQPLVGTYFDADIDMKPYMPTAPQNFQNALQSSSEFWMANQESLNTRFNAWISN